ncbi:hypothetical protein ACTXT7_004481 [Hymenolepis weldensis]
MNADKKTENGDPPSKPKKNAASETNASNQEKGKKQVLRKGKVAMKAIFKNFWMAAHPRFDGKYRVKY